MRKILLLILISGAIGYLKAGSYYGTMKSSAVVPGETATARWANDVREDIMRKIWISTEPPSNPYVGQVYLNVNDNIYRWYDGSNWKKLGGYQLEVSSIYALGNEIYFDTVNSPDIILGNGSKIQFKNGALLYNDGLFLQGKNNAGTLEGGLIGGRDFDTNGLGALQFYIYDGNTGNSYYPYKVYTNGGGSLYNEFTGQVIIGGNQTGNYTLFVSTYSGSGNYNPNLVVHNNGRVGIGTENPSAKLDIENVGTEDFAKFGSAMIVKNNGNVGIGTTGPNKKLHVIDAAPYQARFAYNSDYYLDVGYDKIIATLPSNVYNNFRIGVTGGMAGGGELVLETKGTERVRIDGNGNVGIGTTNPGAKLDTVGTIRTTGVSYPTSGKGVEIRYASDRGEIISYDRDNLAWKPLSLNYGGDVYLCLENGKVGISTSSPVSKLAVNGVVTADDFVTYSPVYTGNALSAIMKIKPLQSNTTSEWQEVDHSSLPDKVRVVKKYKVKRYKDKKTGKIFDIIKDTTTLSNYEIIEETRTFVGRSLDKNIQLNTRAIQQLVERIQQLEARIAVLEGRVK